MATTTTQTDEIAERIAGFIAAAPRSIEPETRAAARRVLGDSVAVALGALDHPAWHAGRRFALRFPSQQGPVLWGTTSRTTLDSAALVNGVLLRCYDYNDFYIGKRNSGHPSDIVAGVMTAAEWTGASGEECLQALALGYEVTGAAFDAFSTAPGGWDYTNLVALGAVASFARLFGLDASATREALAIAVVPHYASDEIESGELNRRGDLTMWKRFNGSDAVRNAMQACLLAGSGVEGAVRPFTGRHGFVAKLANQHDPLPELMAALVPGAPMRRIRGTYMKLWPVGSLAQSAIRAALEARARVVDLGQIREVRVAAEEGAYDHLVRIRSAPWAPISRETADHSLPYIVAAAVLDGFIDTSSFDPARVLDPARQAFLRDKVKVVADPGLGRIADGKLKRAEAGYLSRVEIELVSGEVVVAAAEPFPGHPTRPFTEADIGAKIRQNAEAAAGPQRTARIIEAVLGFERIEKVRDFTQLLAFDAEAALASRSAA